MRLPSHETRFDLAHPLNPAHYRDNARAGTAMRRSTTVRSPHREMRRAATMWAAPRWGGAMEAGFSRSP